MTGIIKRATINAIGTAVYIVLVASLMFFLQSHFSDHKDTMLAPISGILLFVCSAAITGFLVLGKPVMLYIDGKKKDAVLLLGYTIGVLVLITIIAFTFLIIYA